MRVRERRLNIGFSSQQLLFVSTASTEFMGQHSSMFFTKTVANAQQLFLHVLLLMAPFHDDGASPAARTSPHSATPPVGQPPHHQKRYTSPSLMESPKLC